MKKSEIIISSIVIFIIIAAILIVRHYKRKLTLQTVDGMKEYTFKDITTAGIINTLHPLARKIFADFIQQVESPEMGDLTFTITSAVRSFEKQQDLAIAGISPTSVSLHNFGFAIDGNVNGTDINGNKVALRKASPLKDWQPVVDIANKLGLKNGGTFSNTYDPVHFEYVTGKTAKQLLANYQSGLMDNGFVIV